MAGVSISKADLLAAMKAAAVKGESASGAPTLDSLKRANIVGVVSDTLELKG